MDKTLPVKTGGVVRDLTGNVIPPNQLKRKQDLFFDGIEHSFRFVEISYTRLVNALRADAELPPTAKRQLDSAFMDAWGIIDHAKRLRTLLTHARGIQQTPELKVFWKETETTLSFRDYVQHIEARAADVAQTGLPLWGALSWIQVVTPGRYLSKMAALGRVESCELPMVNPAGQTFHNDTDHVQLFTLTGTVGISELVRRIERLSSVCLPAIKAAERAGIRDDQGLLRIVLSGLEAEQ